MKIFILVSCTHVPSPHGLTRHHYTHAGPDIFTISMYTYTYIHSDTTAHQRKITKEEQTKISHTL
ncbi:hypothetical protein LDENG_00223510 [Lucifuga dentata]|nr:hypothetical protein LDENG_00223510 [Lucifuga dentata]